MKTVSQKITEKRNLSLWKWSNNKNLWSRNHYRIVGNFCGYKFSWNWPKFRFQKFSRLQFSRFQFSRLVNLGPADYLPVRLKAEQISTERDGNLSYLFQCGEKSSLVPRTFIETIASALGLHRCSQTHVVAGIEVLLLASVTGHPSFKSDHTGTYFECQCFQVYREPLKSLSLLFTFSRLQRYAHLQVRSTSCFSVRSSPL